MRIASVVGARPQFIKAAPLSRAIRGAGIEEILIHTGQHYDRQMSDIFFKDLDIPAPNMNLEVGSGTHGFQTAQMLIKLEDSFSSLKPDIVLIYGDTNSTLAGSLAASKLQIPIAHVESGLRSFNRLMPEEINRVIADHLSSILFCPSEAAVQNLEREGIAANTHLVGDVMADALNLAVEKSKTASEILKRFDLKKNKFLLATIHRAENTDNKEKITSIIEAFLDIQEPIIFPVHPRTKKILENLGIMKRANIAKHMIVIDPVGYLDMVALEKNARLIVTDSGGIQKEAYWLKVPCVTLREETEWVETVRFGWNILTGADKNKIIEAVESLKAPGSYVSLYGGEGNASQKIAAILKTIEATK